LTAEEIIGRLESEPLERLRWLVLREFRVLPGSDAARELSDEDFIVCGAHMVLDLRLSSENSDSDRGRNEAFSEERFSRLSEEKL